MQTPWNLGIKVQDLDADLAFLEACGATRIEKGAIPAEGGEHGFGLAFLGEQRLLLFPHVIYENACPGVVKPGLMHAVYEVSDVDALIERFRLRGVSPMWGPNDIQTPFGRRRIVFFRSPSNFVFETFQTIG